MMNIRSKNNIYPHRHFTKHLVGAFRKSPWESDLNNESSSLLIQWLKNDTGNPPARSFTKLGIPKLTTRDRWIGHRANRNTNERDQLALDPTRNLQRVNRGARAKSSVAQMLAAGNTGLALVCEHGILRAWAGKKIGTLSELDRRPVTQQIEMRRKSDWADWSWLSRLGLAALQSNGEHKSRPSEVAPEKSTHSHAEETRIRSDWADRRIRSDWADRSWQESPGARSTVVQRRAQEPTEWTHSREIRRRTQEAIERREEQTLQNKWRLLLPHSSRTGTNPNRDGRNTEAAPEEDWWRGLKQTPVEATQVARKETEEERDMLTGPKAQMKNTSDLSQKQNHKSSTHEMKNSGFQLRSNMIIPNPRKSPPSLLHLWLETKN
jgi:hypothetical protein